MTDSELKQRIWNEIKNLPIGIYSKKNGLIATIENGKITMNNDNADPSEYYWFSKIPDDLCADIAQRYGMSLKALQEFMLTLN